MTTKHPTDIFVCRTISTQKTNKMFTPDASISQFVSLSTHVSPTIIKTTGGDYLTTWHLSGLPFVGREEWELEHKHNTFNRLLQSLRAPDYVNVAFWVHDIRRHRGIDLRPKFQESFNQSLSDRYFSRLSKEKLMNNELYLTMIYRPVVDGKKFVDKSGNIDRLKAEQEQAIGTLNELATNLEAVLKDYHPYRLGMYEGKTVLYSQKHSNFSVTSLTVLTSRFPYCLLLFTTTYPLADIFSLPKPATISSVPLKVKITTVPYSTLKNTLTVPIPACLTGSNIWMSNTLSLIVSAP